MQEKMVSIDIPTDYGYVILVASGAFFVNMWLSINVGKARKQHNVKFPLMYSDTNMHFNCIQRAHQNFLEMTPMFLIYMLLAGLMYPRIAAASGVLYLVGRVVYALGYYTGDPNKRTAGFFFFLGQFAVVFTTIAVGLRLNGYY